jgi:hypothetical protein
MKNNNSFHQKQRYFKKPQSCLLNKSELNELQLKSTLSYFKWSKVYENKCGRLNSQRKYHNQKEYIKHEYQHRKILFFKFLRFKKRIKKNSEFTHIQKILVMIEKHHRLNESSFLITPSN